MGGGENIRKCMEKRGGQALRVLTFRGKLEFGSHAGKGVYVWGESGMRAWGRAQSRCCGYRRAGVYPC